MNTDSVMYGGIEINDDKKEYIREKSNIPQDLRYAKALFVPEIGTCTPPPIDLAYNKVKYEADKVAFKYYQEDHWDYYYGIVVDTSRHGCDIGGKPALLINMPYSTKNEELAKEELIKYITEINMLCGIERSVLYFNLTTAYEVICHFSNEENKCQETFESFEEVYHHITKNILCDIESTLEGAAKVIQPIIDENSKEMTPYGMPYVEAGMFFYNKGIMVPSCKMFASSTMQCNYKDIHEWTNGDIFEKSVFNELTNSKLIFTNYTVL